MEIRPAATGPTRRGNSEWFTGTVWQDPIIEAPDPARIKAVRVCFEPVPDDVYAAEPVT